MQKTYTISKDSKELGPYTIDQVLAALSTNEIAVTDFVYLEEEQDWLPLLQFDPVIDYLKSKKPVAGPKKTKRILNPKVEVSGATLNDNNIEWFLLRDDDKVGPLSYFDLIQMLQEKQAYEFDYVWHENLSKWMRIADLREFSPERMIMIMQEHKEIFLARKFPRILYNNDIFISDSEILHKGHCLQISEGGAKLRVAYSMLSPGDIVVLHHKESEALPAFNARCEVVNKSYSQVIRNRNQEVDYIVKYTEINDKAKKYIKELTKKAA